MQTLEFIYKDNFCGQLYAGFCNDFLSLKTWGKILKCKQSFTYMYVHAKISKMKIHSIPCYYKSVKISLNKIFLQKQNWMQASGLRRWKWCTCRYLIMHQLSIRIFTSLTTSKDISNSAISNLPKFNNIFEKKKKTILNWKSFLLRITFRRQMLLECFVPTKNESTSPKCCHHWCTMLMTSDMTHLVRLYRHRASQNLTSQLWTRSGVI